MAFSSFHPADVRLFTYTIASGDMRFIPVNERIVFLRHDPQVGPIIRGEIAGCGPECHANLSQVLLEYALSCAGCEDLRHAGELVDCTGERLGRIVGTKLLREMPTAAITERVTGTFSCLLRSMGVAFEMRSASSGLHYSFVACPLRQAAQQTGLGQALASARRGFAAICAGMLHIVAPDWKVTQPARHESEDLLLDIFLHPL